jgi:hypothetical protein
MKDCAPKAVQPAEEARAAKIERAYVAGWHDFSSFCA